MHLYSRNCFWAEVGVVIGLISFVICISGIQSCASCCPMFANCCFIYVCVCIIYNMHILYIYVMNHKRFLPFKGCHPSTYSTIRGRRLSTTYLNLLLSSNVFEIMGVLWYFYCLYSNEYKVLYSQSYGFCPVVMYGCESLDHKEG